MGAEKTYIDILVESESARKYCGGMRRRRGAIERGAIAENRDSREHAAGFCDPISHRGLRWFRAFFLLALVYDSWCVVARGEMADFFAYTLLGPSTPRHERPRDL